MEPILDGIIFNKCKCTRDLGIHNCSMMGNKTNDYCSNTVLFKKLTQSNNELTLQKLTENSFPLDDKIPSGERRAAETTSKLISKEYLQTDCHEFCNLILHHPLPRSRQLPPPFSTEHGCQWLYQLQWNRNNLVKTVILQIQSTFARNGVILRKMWISNFILKILISSSTKNTNKMNQ